MTFNRYALCIGINKYTRPDATLSGCVNDANDFATLLGNQGYKVMTLLDEEATKEAILYAINELVAGLKYRDRLVITNSSHGSWVPDQSGDETDGRDEVIVTHDLDYILDDDLDAAFAKRLYGTRLTFISDSCFSATVNRYVDLFEGGTDVSGTARFIPPSWLNLAPEQRNLVNYNWTGNPRALTATRHAVLLSGCGDNEYSYDAWFGARANGAFTRAALDTFRDGNTYQEWEDAIRTVLPSPQYPQTPTLDATKYQASRVAID